jgi:hypothetical protein
MSYCASTSTFDLSVDFLLRVENDNACAHPVMVRGRRSLVNSFIAVLWIKAMLNE